MNASQIPDLFQKANQLLDTSQGALEGIQATTDNLNLITTKINTGQGTVGKLINDSTLYRQAAAGVTSLHEDADAMKHQLPAARVLQGPRLRQSGGDYAARGIPASQRAARQELPLRPEEPV
jgi:ABC-type transporter Mla subunit MlaD